MPLPWLYGSRLVLYLYNGALENERRIIDAAYGGNILNTTPVAAMEKIQEMAKGTRSFGRTSIKRGVNAVDSNRSGVESDIAELKDMVRRLTLQGTPHQLKSCGICTNPSHHTDACPSLQADPNAEVNAVGGYRAPRPRNDPYSNNYNPGWRDHPNFRWRDQASQQPY